MAQDILQQAYDGLEGNESWGYFAHDRGSGVGGFLWFGDETSMLFALARYQLLIYLDSEDMDAAEKQLLQEIVDAVDQYQTDRQHKTMVDRINTVADRHFHLKWTGQFQDLLTGEDAFPREVRSIFRFEGRNPGSEQPIEAREREDFLAFLSSYGM